MNLHRLLIASAGLALTAAPAHASDDITDLSLDAGAAYRTSMISDASGHEGFNATLDSEFTPRLTGWFHTRYNLNSSDGYTFSDEDVTNGFEVTRARIGAVGKIHERVRYAVWGEFGSDGDFALNDAWAEVQVSDRIAIRAGQYKPAYLREAGISEIRQLAANRSVFDGFFTIGRSQGVQAAFTGDKFRALASFSDGMNTVNTPFNAAIEADYALTGRVEYLGAGDWGRFADFTSWRGSDRAWLLGGALHWQNGGDTGAIGGTTADREILGATADFSFEGDGWNLHAAFAWQSTDSAVGDFDDMGVLVQGGVFLTDIVELFGRWDMVLADSSRVADDDFHEITVGINYYLIEQSHAAKLTFEAAYFPEAQSTSPVTSSTATGVLSSDDEQFNLRAQFQIVF